MRKGTRGTLVATVAKGQAGKLDSMQPKTEFLMATIWCFSPKIMTTVMTRIAKRRIKCARDGLGIRRAR